MVCGKQSLTDLTFTGAFHCFLRKGKTSSFNRLTSCYTSVFQIVFNEELGSPFTVAHSVSFVKSDTHSVAVLLLRVEKDELDTKGSGFHITLEWVTIAEISKEGKSFMFILLASNVFKNRKSCFQFLSQKSKKKQKKLNAQLPSDLVYRKNHVLGTYQRSQRLKKLKVLEVG